MVVLIVIPKLLLHPILSSPSSLYVVNECCMKSLRPAFCWKWTYQSVLRSTTATTTTSVFVKLDENHNFNDWQKRHY